MGCIPCVIPISQWLMAQWAQVGRYPSVTLIQIGNDDDDDDDDDDDNNDDDHESCNDDDDDDDADGHDGDDDTDDVMLDRALNDFELLQNVIHSRTNDSDHVLPESINPMAIRDEVWLDFKDEGHFLTYCQTQWKYFTNFFSPLEQKAEGNLCTKTFQILLLNVTNIISRRSIQIMFGHYVVSDNERRLAYKYFLRLNTNF